jgi:hypothetical protein
MRTSLPLAVVHSYAALAGSRGGWNLELLRCRMRPDGARVYAVVAWLIGRRRSTDKPTRLIITVCAYDGLVNARPIGVDPNYLIATTTRLPPGISSVSATDAEDSNARGSEA